MTEPFIILFVMLGIISVACFLFKNDHSKIAPVIFLASLIGALVAHMGLRIRELVEGPFAYLDSVLAVITGTIFVIMLMANGTLELYFHGILSKKRNSFIQSLLLLLFVALPGIFTGTASACIFTTGFIAGKSLIKSGIEKIKVVEFIGISSLIGMILPPISLVTMVVVVSRSGSYPASYEGYFLPLLIASIPVLIFYANSSKEWIDKLHLEPMEPKYRSKLYNIPMIVVGVLLIGHNFLYKWMPFLGYPLIFTIGALLAIFMPVRKFKVLESAGKGINIIAPIVALTFAVGSALEILTLVGLSGRLATIYFTTNGILITMVSMLIIIICGLFIGGPMSYLISVLSSYVIGATMYAGNELLLAAISLALALSFYISNRGGLITRIADELGVGEIKKEGIMIHSMIPLGLILVMGIIFTLAYDRLLFLFI